MTSKRSRWLDQNHTASFKLSLECWTQDFWPSAIVFKHWPMVKQPTQKICKENDFIRIVRHSIIQKECFWLDHWDLNKVILRSPFPLLPFLCKDWWAVLFQWYFHRKFKFVDYPMMCSMYEGKQSSDYIANKLWDEWAELPKWGILGYNGLKVLTFTDR